MNSDGKRRNRSWTWKYFKKISKETAVCEICQTEIGVKTSTTGMQNHLKRHNISEQHKKKSQEETVVNIPMRIEEVKDQRFQEKTDAQRSWVWNYFQHKSAHDSVAICELCKREIARNNGTTSGMRNHLKLCHSIVEENDLTTEAETSFLSPCGNYKVDDSILLLKYLKYEILFVDNKPYSYENCFICNEILGAFRNKLSSITGFTFTPLSEILESFTSVDFTEVTLERASICQECFMAIEKYDELQHKAERIQMKLADEFQKTHSSSTEIEEIFINQEQNDYEQDKVESFEEDIVPKDENAKSDEFKVSDKFLLKAEKLGVRYNYEAFQRAFFSEAERESYPNKPKYKEALINSDDEISKDSISIEKIDDELTFQDETPEVKEDDEAKDSINKKNAKKKRAGISNEFRLQIEGIDYNLRSFQKAFGYTETPETNETKSETNVDQMECQKCPLKFSNRNQLLRHIKSHVLNGAKIVCEPCQKKFKSEVSRQVHLATDHDRSTTGPFDCPLCFKSMKDRVSLRMHYYTHTSQRVFLCGRCGATYNHKKSFDLHMMCHDNIRPFPCTHKGCSKSFRNSGKLKM